MGLCVLSLCWYDNFIEYLFLDVRRVYWIKIQQRKNAFLEWEFKFSLFKNLNYTTDRVQTETDNWFIIKQ